MTVATSIPFGQIRFGLLAKRPAPATLAAGECYQAVDVPQLYQVWLDVSGVRYWASLGTGTSSSGLTEQTLTGVGPFSLGVDVADVVRWQPGFNDEAVIELPDTTLLPDGKVVMFITIGTDVGSAVGALTCVAGDLIGPTDRTAVRLYIEGCYQLRSNLLDHRWEILAYAPGVPDSIILYADPSGDDAGPATEFSPALTIDGAMRLAVPYRSDGFLFLNNGFDGFITGSIEVPVPLPGQDGHDFLILATNGLVADPAFTNVTTIAPTAGSTSNPFAPASFSYAANGPLTGNAGRGLFAYMEDGPLSTQSFPIVSSTNTLSEIAGTLSPGVGTHVSIRRPSARVTGPTTVTVRLRMLNIEWVGDPTGMDIDGGHLSLDHCITSVDAIHNGGTLVSTQSVTIDSATGGVVVGDGTLLATLSVLDDVSASIGATLNLTTCSIGIGDPVVIDQCAARFSGVVLYCEVDLRNGATLNVNGANSRGLVDYGLHLTTGATARLRRLSGVVGINGVFLATGGACHVTVEDPTDNGGAGVGTCITAAATAACSVGVLGVKSWTQVNAGAVADCLEIAGAFASGSSVVRGLV